jgi:hypothetical protein
MGGRGSFVNVSSGDFNFVMGGQQYVSLGMVGDVKIIEKIGNPDLPISAPYYSHSPNRIYATVKKGELKYLSFYDENHNQIKSIDFDHAHNGVKPHVHFGMNHSKNSPGIPPSESDWAIINKIKKEMKLK